MRPSHARAWLVAALLLMLGGCVTVESTLRSDGSATLEMTYRTPADATEFLEKRRYSSPYVHVESVKIYEDGRTVLRAAVDDITRLSTAEGFARVLIERSREGIDERLTVRLLNPTPAPVEGARAPWLRIGVLLPGPVRSAGHDGAVSGNHVDWNLSKEDYFQDPETVLTVRWRMPSID